jgi:hypothetical protein
MHTMAEVQTTGIHTIIAAYKSKEDEWLLYAECPEQSLKLGLTMHVQWP